MEFLQSPLAVVAATFSLLSRKVAAANTQKVQCAGDGFAMHIHSQWGKDKMKVQHAVKHWPLVDPIHHYKRKPQKVDSVGATS